MPRYFPFLHIRLRFAPPIFPHEQAPPRLPPCIRHRRTPDVREPLRGPAAHELVHDRLGPIRPHFPKHGERNRRHDFHHLEPRHRGADQSDLCGRERDRPFRELGLYPHHGAREPRHGTVVSRCGEDDELPELPVEHRDHLPHPAHSDASRDEDGHGPRCHGTDGQWRVHVRYARCLLLPERQRHGCHTRQWTHGRWHLESRRLSQ